jgi:hypothetical protein
VSMAARVYGQPRSPHFAQATRHSEYEARRTAKPVVGGIMSFGGPICLWCEAADLGFPMVSLVYPSVYPAKMDGGESKYWCGLWRFFRFRPSQPIPA